MQNVSSSKRAEHQVIYSGRVWVYKRGISQPSRSVLNIRPVEFIFRLRIRLKVARLLQVLVREGLGEKRRASDGTCPGRSGWNTLALIGSTLRIFHASPSLHNTITRQTQTQNLIYLCLICAFGSMLRQYETSASPNITKPQLSSMSSFSIQISTCTLNTI